MNGSTSIESLLNSTTTTNSKVIAPIKDGLIDAMSSKFQGDNKNLKTDGKKQLDKMDFLKLLTTQLKYQDPMNPTNNTEFVAQLAQFSALEGTNNIESAISKLDQSFKETLTVQNFNALSMTNASSVSLIGKKVRIKEDSVSFNGKACTIKVNLEKNPKATVQIIDENKNIIKTFQAADPASTGSATLLWDGLSDGGKMVKYGKYAINVVGGDKDGSLYCYKEDYVSGIRYTEDGPYIKVNGAELPIGNIIDVSQSTDGAKKDDSIIDDPSLLGLIGKKVRYKQPKIQMTPENGAVMNVNVDFGGFSSATLQIVDAAGKTVQTIPVLSQGNKTMQVQIPRIDFNNNGPYSVQFAGKTSAFFFAEGTVEGVNKSNGTIKLKVNGMTVNHEEIYDVFV